MVINIISRKEWNAMPPKNAEKMTHPITKVHLSIENLADPCSTREQCTNRVKHLQNYYSDTGLDDIKYNFLIGNDGNVYEGIGWDHKPGLNLQREEQFRDQTIDIGVICGHNETTPEATEMIALAFRKANEFIKYGVEQKMISEDYQRFGFPEEVLEIDC